MGRDAQFLSRLDAAIAVDEIGIESGGYGIYRLRCLYEQIFERRRQALHAVAMEGMVKAFVAGEEAPADAFHEAVADEDVAFLDYLALALMVRNHANTGEDAFSLVVGLPRSGEGRDYVRFIAGQAEEAGLEPERVICAVEEATANEAGLPSISEEIRHCNMRVAIGDFGGARWTDGKMDILAPDIVRIDGSWFQKVCRDPVTIRLFDSVVARLHERNARVLVGGIDNERQLGVALRAGVDFLKGKHLAEPLHVGMEMIETLSLREKLGNAEKIVPLYG